MMRGMSGLEASRVYYEWQSTTTNLHVLHYPAACANAENRWFCAEEQHDELHQNHRLISDAQNQAPSRATALTYRFCYCAKATAELQFDKCPFAPDHARLFRTGRCRAAIG